MYDQNQGNNMANIIVPIYSTPQARKHNKGVTIDELFAIMKSGKSYNLQNETQKLRRAVGNGDSELKDKIKKRLPSFIITGFCTDNRSTSKFDPKTYTGLIVLDIDKIDDQGKDKEEVLKKAESISYTYATFISPSGRGIKIIVQVDTSSEHHKVAYEQVQKYYQKELGVSVDEASDIVRLCFMCHAPDLYQNKNNTVYVIQPVMEITEVINFTNKKSSFEPGNRNNYAFLLASNLNRAGIDKLSATKAMISQFSESDFTEEEIYKVITSAYCNNKEHGKYKYESSFGQIKEIISVEDHNLCLSELKSNNLEPNEATMVRLSIWALEVENELVINTLQEEVSLIQSTINDCSDSKLLKYICIQNQDVDWDDLSEHEDEEIKTSFNTHQSYIEDYENIPNELFMVAITHFKLKKLTEAYNKLINQAFFVPRASAETYHDQLSKMVQINNAWKNSYDALVLNYLENHRS